MQAYIADEKIFKPHLRYSYLQALIFFGEVLLFMNWAPVGDMVLVRQIFCP